MTVFERTRTRRTACVGLAAATLLWLGVSPSEPAAGRERRLSVVYHPPRLSIEARGVSAAEVLREIGTKVGFAVEGTGAGRPGVSVSVQDATLDEVLRQLLLGENYILVYRAQGSGTALEAIEKIVLLGTPSPAVARLDSGEALPAEVRTEDILRSYQEVTRSFEGAPAPSSTAPWGERDGTRSEVTGEKATDAFPPGGRGTSAALAPLATGPGHSVIEVSAHAAQIPMGLQRQAMERVQALAEALRRAQQELSR